MTVDRIAIAPHSGANRMHENANALLLATVWAIACSSGNGSGSNGVGGAPAGGTSSTISTQAAGGDTSTTDSATGGISTGGTRSSGGSTSGIQQNTNNTGGTTSGNSGGTGGSVISGGTPGNGGTKQTVATAATGGTSLTSASGGATPSGGSANTGSNGSIAHTGGATETKSSGGTANIGGSKATGGSSNAGSSGGSTSAGGCASGPIGTFTGELATGMKFMDTEGNPVNAHGGGIIKEGDTYYMHGEFFLSTTTNNYFNGFAMYSSKDLSTWKNEGIILPQQTDGELGPNRIGERPHIIKCPSTGEFVLYAHAASSDYQTDKEVVYATSPTINGKYTYRGPLTNASGTKAVHSDMSAISDGDAAYVLTESGHVYTLATDCHSWLTDKVYSAVNGDSGGIEAPTVFKAGNTYYWIGSYKTGWRANNNFYSTAPSMTGPWTYQGYIAPVKDPADHISDERTWLSQVTWVQPVVGCQGTVYVFWGDHWYGTESTTNQGKHNDQATYVFQPLVFNGTAISLPTYLSTWKLDVGYGTWSH